MTSRHATVQFRRATPGDAATVHALARDLAAEAGLLATATTSEDRCRDLLGRDDVVVLVVAADERPVGFVSGVRAIDLWSGRLSIDVDDVYVADAVRHLGIGAAMMRAFARECGDVTIRWEVDEGNLAAQRFSVRLGAQLRRRVVARWTPGDGTNSDLE